ncbi:dTDP-4-amino-4,6-dideoxygalactose transaminase [Pseudidiomarina insulisalsae]|uniref:dTDP-4-amino-4,6-dideoxygalactose transaminase n=1 Tax=Pseudidiomarina insulisalsae TaxID=575789 RepID=A0A432YNV1_9GAMM|nr:dTDP-4-amino-4,6-dideoxygalactose transaminase [Pseudidiomarina insulisalsae]RUO62630.1 dTDP-4-amino-4,6-dideoxygalactose transaminase [Pseudidiomarina insulisalsae]
MIEFNRKPYTGNEDQYILEALQSPKMSGDGTFTKHCHQWFQQQLGCAKALLTPSCTHSLEMAALLINVQPGDEIIMPSYTFVSTANAFVLRGAKIVFVDVRPDTMNIDEQRIEAAITERTKAIVPVHYAGVGCEMDTIMELAEKHDLFVIEDAAQGMMSTYKGKPLGTLGHIGCFSFHDTKNYTSGGEGGLLIVNDENLVERAEILREKGTNRSKFLRGAIDKYTWVDVGSSFLPGELQAAYLWGQLQQADTINKQRRQSWQHYYDRLQDLQQQGRVELPQVPDNCVHNAHIFYLKAADIDERSALIEHLKARDIATAFHYIPLHSAPSAHTHARFHGDDRFTTQESERLIRLPMWYGLSHDQREHIINAIYEFYA